MDLTIYNIILGPVVTDKAYRLSRKTNTIALRVHAHANKPLVKQAVEKLFDVKVKDVRIVVRKGKNKRVGRRAVVGSSVKKALVTLKPGSSLNLFEQVGGAATHGAQGAAE